MVESTENRIRASAWTSGLSLRCHLNGIYIPSLERSFISVRIRMAFSSSHDGTPKTTWTEDLAMPSTGPGEWCLLLLSSLFFLSFWWGKAFLHVRKMIPWCSGRTEVMCSPSLKQGASPFDSQTGILSLLDIQFLGRCVDLLNQILWKWGLNV